jgi:hypothetical protein
VWKLPQVIFHVAQPWMRAVILNIKILPKSFALEDWQSSHRRVDKRDMHNLSSCAALVIRKKVRIGLKPSEGSISAESQDFGLIFVAKSLLDG